MEPGLKGRVGFYIQEACSSGRRLLTFSGAVWGRVCRGEWRAQRKIQAGCPSGMLGSRAGEAVFWVTSGSPRSWGPAGLNSEAGLNTQPHRGLSCHRGSWDQRCSDPDGQPTLRASMGLQTGSCAPNQQHPVAPIKGTPSSADLKGLLTRTLLGSGLVRRPSGSFPATRAASQADTRSTTSLPKRERSPAAPCPQGSGLPGAGTSAVEEGRAGEQ